MTSPLGRLMLFRLSIQAPGKPATPAKLVPALVAKKLGLKPDLVPAKLLEAIAIRELGFPEVGTWPELQTTALNRLMGRTMGQAVNLAGKQLAAQVPLAVLGVPRA